jgi:hypothetical protein
MAQTGFTPILLYASNTVSQAPSASDLTNSASGSELAINITDGKLFYKDNANAVQVIGWKTVPTTAGGTGLTTYTAGDLSYYASGTTFTKLAIGTTGQILTSTGSAPQWSTLSGVAVTTFSAGTTGFTPNSATSGAITLAGTLVAVNGGTGQSSYTTGDLLFASSTTALSKLADVATGNALISGGVGVAPAYGKIGLTTHVSETLPVGNGGTGTATAFTAGSVIFAGASGVYSQDNSNFFWDAANVRLGIDTATPACALDVVGGIQTSRTAVTAPAASDGNVFSGTYTPTLTNSTNVASSTASELQYMRVGSVVTVSGLVAITPTAGSDANTVLRMSLPISSNFASTTNLGGTGVISSAAGRGVAAAIYADTTNDLAEFNFLSPATSGLSTRFTFTYRII